MSCWMSCLLTMWDCCQGRPAGEDARAGSRSWPPPLALCKQVHAHWICFVPKRFPSYARLLALFELRGEANPHSTVGMMTHTSRRSYCSVYCTVVQVFPVANITDWATSPACISLIFLPPLSFPPCPLPTPFLPPPPFTKAGQTSIKV